ncbi:MAG: hypothetical protein ABW204_10825 [Microbacteriaceae bacterium]
MSARSHRRKPPRRPDRLDRILIPIAVVLAIGAAVLVVLALTR